MTEGSHILITEDFEGFKESLKEKLEPHRLHILERDEFKIEDASELINEAMLSVEDKKFIVAFANRYNVYAQNRLLKIIEEPPKNIYFILVAKNSSTFLPTVLSRLPVKKIKTDSLQEDIDFENFDLEMLYKLVKEAKKRDKRELKAVVKGMLKYSVKEEFRLDERELDSFKRAFELIELNAAAASTIITTGLIVLKHKKKKR